MAYLSALLDSIADLAPEKAIGGVLMAFLLASPMALIYAATRRMGRDASLILVASGMATNVVGMVMVLGYVRLSSENEDASPGVGKPGPRARIPGFAPPPGPFPLADLVAGDVSRRIVEAGDLDRDGWLSRAEAAAAAAGFVDSAAVDDEESIDEAALRSAIAASLRIYMRPPGRGPRATPVDATGSTGLDRSTTSSSRPGLRIEPE